MSWRDTIKPDDQEHSGEASFRGVWFKTRGAELDTGRRTVTHEYAERDTPYSEDMGRRARHWRVEGYVIGDDYMEQRDALIEALEEPGPGELRHPRYGVLQVCVAGHVSVKEGHSEGGLARFAITFVEAGENDFPSSTDDSVQEVDDAAGDSEGTAIDEFEEMLDVAGPASILDSAITAVQTTVEALQDIANQVVSIGGLTALVGQAVELVENVEDLLALPGDLADRLQGIFGGLVQSVDRPRAALQLLEAVHDQHAPPQATARPGSTADRIVRNATAHNELVRTLSLAAQARLVAIAISGSINQVSVAASVQPAAGTSVTVAGVTIGTSGAAAAGATARRSIASALAATLQLREAPVATSSQALQLRDAVLDRIDAELEEAEPSPKKAEALLQLRAALATDVTVRAELLRERSTFTPAAELPALALAHRIYQDATRAGELIARNGIANPNFVPVMPLEVLQ